MADFFDDIGLGDTVPTDRLQQVRLGTMPVMLLHFTKEGERLHVHWSDHDEAKGYLCCPGSGCPLCYLGDRANDSFLLPAYNVESARVEVLRVPVDKRPEGLCVQLMAQLKAGTFDDRLFLVRRNGFGFQVVVRPMPADANRGVEAIRQFLERVKSGLRLRSALLELTVAEIAEIGGVRLKLDAMGWRPPQDPPNTPAAVTTAPTKS